MKNIIHINVLDNQLSQSQVLTSFQTSSELVIQRTLKHFPMIQKDLILQIQAASHDIETLVDKIAQYIKNLNDDKQEIQHQNMVNKMKKIANCQEKVTQKNQRPRQKKSIEIKTNQKRRKQSKENQFQTPKKMSMDFNDYCNLATENKLDQQLSKIDNQLSPQRLDQFDDLTMINEELDNNFCINEELVQYAKFNVITKENTFCNLSQKYFDNYYQDLDKENFKYVKKEEFACEKYLNFTQDENKLFSFIE